MEFGKAIKHKWLIDDSITFLNNGSFGATPIPVIEEAERIYRRLEKEPVSFFVDSYFGEIRTSATQLAGFLGCNPDDLVFVDNATSGANVVLRSLIGRINPDDEILINNHSYPAVKSACQYISEITGCKITEMHLPFPFNDEEHIIDCYRDALTPKTKLLILDHILYTTGMINPVKEITRIAKQNGTLVFIDGAHAPGMIDLNIDDIGADWYTGNCHKWLFAPKGCALLWTSPANQSWTKPLSISFFHGQGYAKEFDWTGTKNPVPYLAINKAIDFHRSLDSSKLMSYIHDLAIEARHMIADELKIEILIPERLIGSLIALQMPGDYQIDHQLTAALRKRLFEDYKIEMPFIEFDGKLFFRFSAQVFNEMDDYKKLLTALKVFKK
jgi:isopenicillin-N epimerase